MALSELTLMEILIGTFDLIYSTILIILGGKILKRYFSYKEKTLITVGLTWIFISIGWLGEGISFLLFLFLDRPLNKILFLIIANVFTPVGIIFWIYSFCQLFFPNLKKILIPLYCIIGTIYEIFFFLFLFTNPEILGTFSGNFYLKPNIYTMSFQAFTLITVMITGTFYIKESLKINDPKIKVKAVFLSIAIVSLTLSMFIEGFILLNPIALLIIRFNIILSLFEFYLGFLMPNRIVKLFVKDFEVE